MSELDISKLVCYGCCHLVGNGEYPGAPSGERPCMFCIRNPTWEEAQKKFEERTGHRLVVWYDGTPAVKVPMDCYHSLDMLDQFSNRYKEHESKQKTIVRSWKNSDGTYEWKGNHITAEEMITMGAILTEAGLNMMEPIETEPETPKKRINLEPVTVPIQWRCPECGDFVTSDPMKHHQMDTCECGKTSVDLEQHYCRTIGNPVWIKKDEEGK